MTTQLPLPVPGEEMHLLPAPLHIVIIGPDGKVVVKLLENPEGTLGAEIPGRDRLPEAVRIFADQLASLAGCRIVHIDPVTGRDLTS